MEKTPTELIGKVLLYGYFFITCAMCFKNIFPMVWRFVDTETHFHCPLKSDLSKSLSFSYASLVYAEAHSLVSRLPLGLGDMV